MLDRILAISGKPGLFRLVARGNNNLIVESLTDGRRMPAHQRDRVLSLGDIAMYTVDGEVPLALCHPRAEVVLRGISHEEAVRGNGTPRLRPDRHLV